MGELWSLRKAQAPVWDDRCEHCGARLSSVRVPIRETVAEVICGSLLLTVLTLAGYFAYQWMEREGHRIFVYPVWHEPRDDWSL